MGSRRSLRLQIVVILLTVLGAEALLSSLWLLLVVPPSLRAEQVKLTTNILDASAGDLGAECGSPPAAACARPLVDALQHSHFFRAVRLSAEGLDVTGGEPSGPADVAIVDPRGFKLEAWLDLHDTRARGAQLFEFHLVNLFVAVVGLLLLGMLLFDRVVSRPVEQLAAVADRIGHLELEGLTDGQASPVLGQLSLSFERMARALKREQDRVNQQISELTRMNKDLKDARDAVVRQEKLATVGRLAAGVAHEVGNPLGGILGYAELLKTREEPTVKDYAERIEREVARIDRTVRGLLDFSRPSQAQLAPISLAASVQRALALCQADKRFREVEPIVEIAPELQVMADEHRLGQVLVNLLLNAGDAMQGKGKVTLRATLREDEAKHRRASDPPPGKRVELAVEDTGPGIPAEVLPRIFDPFFTTKEVGQGTGLGLSISASIMEAFGGELRAENRAEGGARFWMVLRTV
ncbi:MAG: hypothetical protein JST54_02550 [Deltaproteobacteria bacterium]|nr:hypothetical protein [Deltaproteobacteria bacterium]